MQPQDFVRKWADPRQSERASAQSHFNDLCALLGEQDPHTADPAGESFAFEKGARKSTGGDGWADVWKRDCFAWEYKKRRNSLDSAFDQLLRYSHALGNPPLLIVSDIERYRIHTNWTNTVHRVEEFTTHDLLDAGVRDLLKAAFVEPERLKPGKTRQALTEEAASTFAGLAQRLRARGTTHRPSRTS